MKTALKWLAIFAAVGLSVGLWTTVSAAQEKPAPGDRPKVEPRGEFDRESGPPGEPRKPGAQKPRPGLVPESDRPHDRPGEQKPRRPDFGRGQDHPHPGRPGEGFREPMNNPPVTGPKPGADGQGRGPGPGVHMGPGLPFGPPLDPETEALNRKEMDLERECAELASRLRRAAKDERETLKKQLTEAVNRHFDVRQERRELQLKHLEDELKRLREANQKRLEAREELVKRRLADLMGQDDDLRF